MSRIVKIFQVLFGICFFIALGPLIVYIYYIISGYKVEIDVIFYNVIFCMINFSPMFIIYKNISNTKISEEIFIPRNFGGILASILFILVNVSFHLIVLHSIIIGEEGSSTSVIAYMYLPILSYSAVGIGFFIGTLGYKLGTPVKY